MKFEGNHPSFADGFKNAMESAIAAQAIKFEAGNNPRLVSRVTRRVARKQRQPKRKRGGKRV